MEKHFNVDGCEVTFKIPFIGKDFCAREPIQDFINENIHRYTNYDIVSTNGMHGIWKFSFSDPEEVKKFFIDLNNNKETCKKIFGGGVELYGEKCLVIDFYNLTFVNGLHDFLAEQHTTGLLRFVDHRDIYWKFVFSNKDERAAFIETIKKYIR